MPHAIPIRQTGGPEVLNWTAVDVGEPGSGQVRLRQAAAGLNYIDVYHGTGYYPQPLLFTPGLEGAGTVEAVAPDVRGLKVGDRVAYAGPTGGYSEVRPRGLMVTFGQASGPIDPIAPVLLSQKGSLFLTRPILFHYIQRRDALEVCANELFEVVASGKVRINVNQRFALKDAADAHKALEARATSGSTILTI
jgi:NADPH:quinone reductase-like Zn-dependent oxidoreductase